MGAREASQLIAVFQQQYDGLLRFLTQRTSDPQRAADIVQDTYLRLASLPERIGRVENPRAYIFRIARNLAIDAARRDRSGAEDSLADGNLAARLEDEASSPEAALYARERLRLLDRALADLSANGREALLLSRVMGLSHAEIAARLGVSESMVAKYLAQALRHCRAALEKNGEKK